MSAINPSLGAAGAAGPSAPTSTQPLGGSAFSAVARGAGVAGPVAGGSVAAATAALRGGTAGSSSALGSIAAQVNAEGAEFRARADQFKARQRANDKELFDAVRQDPAAASQGADAVIQMMFQKQASGAAMGPQDLMAIQAANRVKETVALVEKVSADPAGAARWADGMIAEVRAREDSGEMLGMIDRAKLDVATRVKDAAGSITSETGMTAGAADAASAPEVQKRQDGGDALAQIRADPKGAMRFADSVIAQNSGASADLHALQAARALKETAALVEKVQADPAAAVARADAWIAEIDAKGARGALEPSDLSRLSVALQTKAIVARFEQLDAGAPPEIGSAKHGAAMAAIQGVE